MIVSRQMRVCQQAVSLFGLHVLAIAWLVLPASGEERHCSLELEERFLKTIYPLLTRGGEQSCVGCHDASSNADLEFVGDARDDFRMLLDGGYFKTEQADGLLSRIRSTNPKRRMPKGDQAVAWSKDEIAGLESFSAAIVSSDLGHQDDESFPGALLSPYRGESARLSDTQLLSYTQLKGKILTLFGDAWIRNGVDRFKENVALFGGADFETRFNESTQASSGYMSALSLLARDVAERALVARSGPFSKKQFSAVARSDRDQAVQLLYEDLLNRAPTEMEIADGRALYRSIASESDRLVNRPYELSFSIEAYDPETALKAERIVRIPVRAGTQQFIQERLEIPDGASKSGPVKTLLQQQPLLFAEAEDQEFVIQTRAAIGQVSFVGLLVEEREARTVEWIDVQDPRVRLEGAWKLSQRNGYWSADLEAGGARDDRLSIPLRPEFDGTYQITVYWRPRNQGTAGEGIFAEVGHQGKSGMLAEFRSGPSIKDGVVSLSFDGTIDTKPHVDFEPFFQFGQEGFIEINNTGTSGKVAVGPLGFEGRDGKRFEIDTKHAEGFGEWSPFKAISFNAYNARGTRVEDKNKRKGELFLRYRVGAGGDAAWNRDEFYRLRVFYPGKRDHASRIPLKIRSVASSPILNLSYPLAAGRGSRVILDANDSFTSQGSDLEYRWTQLGGIPVGEIGPGGRVEFDVPNENQEYQFWWALTQGLIRHPDFLFTRPPALDWVSKQDERRKLTLSRLALDLAGRAPTREELVSFLSHWDWERAVDYYLASDDFRNFYRHRIRLYLESQGTVEQDEPVRLWCYVAFNDLPFQEILIGNYTVDESMKKRARPVYHGRTGVLTTPGFIAGKPGLPHYNYAAQVSMLFLGYRYEVPPDIVEQREGITALGTTDPNSACYGCHKILTPLAFQRNFWTDDGKYRLHDDYGLPIEASDQGMVAEYPFKGEGLEAFALKAVKKERFVRTVIDTHFDFLFGRSMRYRTDERELYKNLWDEVHQNGFKIKGLLRKIAMSPEYVGTD